MNSTSHSTRSEFLPFALPDVGSEEIDAIAEVLRSGWITTGPLSKKFETEFASALGVPHAVAVNSCTAALHLALEAVGITEGDEVIVPAYTFAATAEVVRYFHAHPVLVDVRADDLNIDPDAVRRALTPRTKAIIPVHLAGLPADLPPLFELAREQGCALIEDAAHAFPAALGKKQIGQCWDERVQHATCFSFYANKTMTTGEGGMVATTSAEIAERCRIMSLHGISKDAWKRFGEQGNWYYEIVAPGFKYNMTDISAAMGLAQLAKARSMAQRRYRIKQVYDQAFAGNPHLQTPASPDGVEHAWHLYMLRLNLDTLAIDRGRFVEEMKKRNIGCSVHYIPLHCHPYYRERYGFQNEDFPVAYSEYLRGVSLPIYSRMSDADVEDVANAVIGICQQFAK